MVIIVLALILIGVMFIRGKKLLYLLLLLLYVAPLHAQFTITENFKGSSSGNVTLGEQAKLTSGTIDPAGEGWLRLTEDMNNQAGYAFVNQSFPSTLGILMDFEYVAWRRDNPQFGGADGFSIFLYDATATPFRRGALGGSLGYSQGTSEQGLNGGYVGIGIDEFGNYAQAGGGKIGGLTGGNEQTRDWISARGQQPNYTYISGSPAGVSLDYDILTQTRPTESQFYRRVQVEITPIPATGQYSITVNLKTSPTGNFRTVFGPTTLATPPPANLKLGFAASTGGGYNKHEVRNLIITTPGNLRVQKLVDKPLVAVGGELTYTVTVYNETTGTATGLPLQDVFTPANGFNITSVQFSNDNFQGNTATGYTNTSFSNVTLNMQPRSSVTFTIKGRVAAMPANGILSNKVYIDPTPTGITDPDKSNDTSVVTTQVIAPDLAIQKTHSGSFRKGQTGTYTLTVNNAGVSAKPMGSIVTVRDLIPAGLVAGTPTGTGWTFTGTSGNSITATRTDALAAGAAYPSITIPVTVNTNAPNTIINNTSVANEYESNLTNNNAADTVDTRRQADLEVVSISSNTTRICTGTTFRDTVRVRNNGPDPATNARFTLGVSGSSTVALLSRTITSGTGNFGTGVSNGSVYTDSVSLSNGGTAIYVFNVTVNGSGTITSTASLLRGETDIDPDASDPTITRPTDPQHECDAAPSGAGCNNIKTGIVTVDQQPDRPDAGPDQGLCNVTSATLAGNTPTTGTGQWVQLGGPSTATIANPSLANTGVSNLVPGGDYTFLWRITNGSCGTLTDTVLLRIYPSPGTPNAGPDQALCNVTAATMAGSAPPALTAGQWTQTAGPNTATIALPGNNNTGISNLVPGTYRFAWTIRSGVCTPASDTMELVISAPPTTANAGPDQLNYNSGTFIMAGNNPTVGTGQWTVAAGNATISAPNNPSTSVTIAPNTSATLVWSITNGSCPPSRDTVIVTFTHQADVVIVKTDAGNTYRTGSTLTYVLTVTNAGPSDVKGIVIQDLLPLQLENPVWSAVATGTGVNIEPTSGSGRGIDIDADIPAGAGNRITVTITGKIAATATGGTVITNTGSVATPIETPDPNQDNNASTVTGTVPNNPPIAVDDQVSTVRDVPVSGNVLDNDSDPENDPLTVKTTPVTPPTNGTVILNADGTFTYTPNPGYTGNDRFVYEVCDSHNACARATVFITITAPRMRLSVVKTAAPANAVAGQALVYTITVTNNGPSSLLATETFNVQDQLPDGFIANSFVPERGTYTGNNGNWTGVALAPGASVRLTITGTVTSGYDAASLSNIVTVTPPPTVVDPPGKDTLVTPVGKTVEVTVTKTDNSPTYTPGTNVEYIITVRNNGPSDLVDARFTDPLPAGITTASWTVIASGRAAAPGAGGTGAIDQLVSIPAGGNLVYRLTLTVPAAFTGNLANTATITVPAGYNNLNPENNTATDTDTPLSQYNIRALKSGPQSKVAGTAITYLLAFFNTGPSDLRNAVIEDILPPEVTGATWSVTTSGNATASVSTGSGNINFTGNLPAGAANKIMVTINGTVDPAATGDFDNQATITPPGGTAVPSNEINTVIENKTGLTLVKSGPAEGHVDAGRPIQYTLRITNAGPSNASAAVIEDIVPAAITGVTWSATASGAAAIAAGSPSSGSGNNIRTAANIPAGSGNEIIIQINGTVNPAATGNLVNAASVTPPGGTPVRDTVETMIDLESQLQVSKSGPAKASAGSRITYNIDVTNNGPSDAVGTRISDMIPPSLTDVNWTATASGAAAVTAGGTGTGNNLLVTANIPAGNTNRVNIVVTGTIAPNVRGTIHNTASASANGEPPVNSDTVETIVENVPGLQLSKAGPATISAGGRLTYTLQLTNSGPSDATNVIIKDTLPVPYGNAVVRVQPQGGATVLSQNITDRILEVRANIPAGSTHSLTVFVSGTIDPAFRGTVRNRGFATTDGGVTTPSDEVVTTVTGEPKIEVHKIASDTLSAGDEISYTLIILNTGLSDAAAITLRDVIPSTISNVTWNSSVSGTATITSGGTGTGNNVVLTGSIPAGSENFIVIGVEGIIDPAFTGVITNFATVDGTDVPPVNSDTTVTHVVRETSLRVTKTGPSTLAAGNGISYTITATNGGPSNATGVNITDLIPAAIQNASWTSVTAGGATITSGATGTGNNLSMVANIPAGAGKVTITVTGTMNAGEESTVVNTVSVTEPGKPPVTDTVNTVVTRQPQLQISKTGPATISAGEQLTYTINVTNAGPSNAASLRIQDLIPAQLQQTTWTATAVGAATITSGATGTGNNLMIAGSLNAGSGNRIDITVTGTVDPAFTGEFNNQAAVLPERGDTVVSNVVNTKVSNKPGLQLVKSAPDTLSAGSIITYTVNITNSGPSNATNIQITDVVPAEISATEWTVSTLGSATTSTNNGTGNNVSFTANIPAGADHAVQLTITGKVAPDFRGTLVNQAKANIPGQPEVPSNETSTTIVATPGVDLLKAGPTTIQAGNRITYTLNVSNFGPSDAIGLVIRDTVPSAIRNVTWTTSTQSGATVTSGATGSGNDIRITANIPAGARTRVFVNITGTLDAAYTGSTLLNRGIAEIAGQKPDTSGVTTNVIVKPNVQISKTGPGSLNAGDPVNYTISLVNHGPSNASGITIADILDPAILNPAWTATVAGTGTSVSSNSGTGNINITGNLPAGDDNRIDITVTGTLNPAFTGDTIRNRAVVTATGQPNDTATVVTPVTREADLRIVKTGPENAVAGENISYTVTVRNEGPSNANGVIISDTIPSAVTNVSWTATATNGATVSVTSGTGPVNLTANLPAGTAEVNITINGVINPAFPQGDIINTATATPPPGVEDPDPTTSTVITHVKQQADLVIVKSGPATRAAGQAIRYQLVITNRGISDVSGALITDLVPAAVNITAINVATTGNAQAGAPDTTNNTIKIVGSVAAGAANSIVVTIDGIINPAATGSITNTSSVTPPDGVTETNPSNNNSSITTQITTDVGIQLSKSGPASVNVRDQISYTIELTNNGLSDANGIIIEDPVPADISNVTWQATVTGNASVSAASGTGNNINLTGSLGASLSGTIRIVITGTVQDNAASTIVNTVTTTFNGQKNSTVTTAVNKSVDLRINKTAPAELSAGEPITYVVTVNNGGPADAINALLEDQVPAPVTNITWTAVASGGASVAQPSGTGNNISLGMSIPANNGTVTLTIHGIVDPAFSGMITNTATANPPAGVTDPRPAIVSVNTKVNNEPGLSIIKSGPQQASAGDRITYTLEVRNGGPSAASGVTIRDAVPADISNVSWTSVATNATITGGATGNGNTVQLQGNIPVDGVIRVTINGTINPAFAGVIRNSATIATSAETISSNEVATLVSNAPGLVVHKSGPATAVAGQQLRYQITVVNNGPSDAMGVVVRDDLPPAVRNAIWSASANGTAAITGGNITGQTGNVLFTGNIPAGSANTIVVTVDADIDPAATGTITNTATATPDGGTTVPSDPVITNLVKQAGVRLVKSAPDTIAAGNTLVYQIDVYNDGPSASGTITVTDILPPQMLQPVWSATATGGAVITGGNISNRPGNVSFQANIPAGSANAIRITVSGKADPSFAGIIENEAQAQLDSGIVPSNDVQTVVVNQPGIAMVKSGPSTAAAGTTITYDIVMTNNGPSDAANISIADALPAQLLQPVWSATASGTASISGGNISNRPGNVAFTGSIPAGANNRIVVHVTGTIDPAFTGTITNVATYTPPGGTPVTTPPVTTTVTADAALSISKSGPDELPAGSDISYTIQVQNAGPSNASGIRIADMVPATVEQVTWNAVANGGAAITGPATGSGNTISLQGSIPAGSGNIIITVNGKINAAFTGTVLNRATATVNDTTVADSARTVIVNTPGVTFSKSGPLKAQAGDQISYEINVGNTGPSDLVGARLSDLVPATIGQVTWTVALQGNARLTSGSASGTGNTIRLTADIPAGAGNEVIVTVKGVIDPSFSGNIVNTATLVDANDSTYTADATTEVNLQSDVQLRKIGPAEVKAGESISYVIQVTNAGPSNLSNAVITDAVPAGITQVSWSATGNGAATITGPSSGTGNNVSITGNIPAGAANNIEISINGVILANTTQTSITNSAVLQKPDGTKVPSDTVVTTINRNAALQLLKSAPATADAGDTMTYIISAGNNGPADATGIIIRDTIPAQLTGVRWTATGIGGATTATTSGTGNIISVTANIPAGAANEVRIQITGRIAADFKGTLVNRAVATHDGKETPSNITTTTVDRNADLYITKTGPASVINTGKVTYILEGGNYGTADASGAVITDQLPAAIQNPVAVVTTLQGGAANVTVAISNNKVTATAGTFPAGAMVRISVTGTVSGSGELSNIATITPPPDVPDPDPEDNTTPPVITPIIPQTKLQITKDVISTGPYVLGSKVRYRLTVNNPGQLVLSPVDVTDRLPQQVSAPAGITPSQGTTAFDAGTRLLSWNIGSMAANARATLEYEVTVQQTGTITNTAIVKVPEVPDQPTPAIPDTSTSTIDGGLQADLQLRKELVTPAPLRLAGKAEFLLTLTNAGPNTATGVVVADTLVSSIDILGAAEPSSGITSYDAVRRILIWHPENIAAGQTVTLRFTTRINAPGTVTNRATATGAEPDPDLSNNTAQTRTEQVGGDDIFIPNVITPNGDGKNDKFMIIDITRFPGSTLYIYNRWGNMVYQSKNYHNEWTGEGLNEGTYYYLLHLNTPTGVKVYKGWIELLR